MDGFRDPPQYEGGTPSRPYTAPSTPFALLSPDASDAETEREPARADGPARLSANGGGGSGVDLGGIGDLSVVTRALLATATATDTSSPRTALLEAGGDLGVLPLGAAAADTARDSHHLRRSAFRAVPHTLPRSSGPRDVGASDEDEDADDCAGQGMSSGGAAASQRPKSALRGAVSLPRDTRSAGGGHTGGIAVGPLHGEAGPPPGPAAAAADVQPTAWMFGICVVNFDLDMGQSLEATYPPGIPLSKSELNDICFSALPDSNVTGEGDCVYTIRLPCLLPIRCPTEVKVDAGYTYGYVYFRQQRDAQLRRGYLQKSIVLLSALPYFDLFEGVMEDFGPAYFDGSVTLQGLHALVAERWPPLQPARTLKLPMLGVPPEELLHLDADGLPVDELLQSDVSALDGGGGGGGGNSGNGPAPAAAPYGAQGLSVYEELGGVLDHLWVLWELLLLGEPLLVLAPSPAKAGCFIRALFRLLRPLQYAGDWRPYFTIHNSEFKRFSQKNRTLDAVVVGVTNPFFEVAFDHWPHLAKLPGAQIIGGGGGGGTSSLGGQPGAGGAAHWGRAHEVNFSPTNSGRSSPAGPATPRGGELPRFAGHNRTLSETPSRRAGAAGKEDDAPAAASTRGQYQPLGAPAGASSGSSGSRPTSSSGYKQISAIFGIHAGGSGSSSSGGGLPGRMHGGSGSVLSKWKPWVSRDKALLKKIAALETTGYGSAAQLDRLILQSFHELTERFLTPLNRYTASLLPRMGSELQPALPALAPFDRASFLQSLAEFGTSLLFKPKRGTPRAVADFYQQFMAGPQFKPWLAARLALLRAGVAQKHLNALGEVDIARWGLGRTREEILAMRNHILAMATGEELRTYMTEPLMRKLRANESELRKLM